jgi:hypothetical protein
LNCVIFLIISAMPILFIMSTFSILCPFPLFFLYFSHLSIHLLSCLLPILPFLFLLVCLDFSHGSIHLLLCLAVFHELLPSISCHIASIYGFNFCFFTIVSIVVFFTIYIIIFFCIFNLVINVTFSLSLSSLPLLLLRSSSLFSLLSSESLLSLSLLLFPLFSVDVCVCV